MTLDDRIVGAHLDGFGILEGTLGVGHILGDVHQHRSGSAGTGKVEGLLDRGCKIARPSPGSCASRRAGDADGVDFRKASWPITRVGTWPEMITNGIESQNAVAMPVTALAAPGPEVTSATPTLSVTAHRHPQQHRGLLMTNQYVTNRSCFEQFVIQEETAPPGYPKIFRPFLPAGT